MKRLSLWAVLLVGGLLLWGTVDFPAWGDPHSPANASPVSRHYITQSLPQTAVPNVVTSVLADYRGYDTLFETVVVFTAGAVIAAVLGLMPARRRESPSAPMPASVPASSPAEERLGSRDVIVVITCRLLIPVIQLFALYVVAHGHHSPGGGFQGGVILGASLILLAIARDLPTALRRVPERLAVVLGVTGILIYAGIGLLCLLLGGNFLDYSQLRHVLPATDGIMARSHGMLGVEIGVAFTVAATMYAIYAHLSSRGRMRGGL